MVLILGDFGGLVLQGNCLFVGCKMESFTLVSQSTLAILTIQSQSLGCTLSILIISAKQWNFDADYFLTFTLCCTNQAQLEAPLSVPSSIIFSMIIAFMMNMKPSCLGHTFWFRQSSTLWRKLPLNKYTSQQAVTGTSGAKAEKRSKGAQP